MGLKNTLLIFLIALCYSFGSEVQVSEIKIQPSEEGMILIEFGFNYGYPQKYNVAFGEVDENSLILTMKGVDFDSDKILVDLELNNWMRVAKKEINGEFITFVSFDLQKRVPYKSYFSSGKLYISFADVRYTNTVRTVLLWLAIPVALLFTVSAFLLIES
ncbi:MAG: hypothetical protein OCC49_17975 [Fibrobacterales bacterium]